MKKIRRIIYYFSLAFVGGLIGGYICRNLHKDCPMVEDRLPAIHLHAGQEMPQYCACKMPSDIPVLMPVEVYTYGEDGKLLPDTPQPREAYFKVKHNSLRHNKLVFFGWKEEKMSSPEE